MSANKYRNTKKPDRLWRESHVRDRQNDVPERATSAVEIYGTYPLPNRHFRRLLKKVRRQEPVWR